MAETDPSLGEDSTLDPDHVIAVVHEAAESRRTPSRSFDRAGRGINDFLVQQVIGIMRPASNPEPASRRKFSARG
jgi:hypothetical protein